MTAQVVLTWDGSPPPHPDALLNTPGVVVGHVVILAGQMDALWSNPFMQAWSDENVPVVLSFEDEEDAVEFERRMQMKGAMGRA